VKARVCSSDPRPYGVSDGTNVVRCWTYEEARELWRREGSPPGCEYLKFRPRHPAAALDGVLAGAGFPHLMAYYERRRSGSQWLVTRKPPTLLALVQPLGKDYAQAVAKIRDGRALELLYGRGPTAGAPEAPRKASDEPP
jgi:hypothetical protein